MQSLCIAKTGSQPIRPKVAAFMGKIECKKYTKAVWNSMSKEQQMQMRGLCEQQCIKPVSKHPKIEARIAALEAQLRVHSQPEQGDIVKKKERLLKKYHGGETEGILW